MNYELRDYQREAIDATWLGLKSQPGNPCVVLPTGAGKSVVIADFARTAWEQYGVRSICLAHRKELLEQNAEKLRSLVSCDVGLYSAGLRTRDLESPIICSGIQSCYFRASEFGERRLVIVDESHLIPPADNGNGMYHTFLRDLQQCNPKLRIIGLTATPYRTSTGSILAPDGLLNYISHEVPIRPLITQGYLASLTLPEKGVHFDTSGLHVQKGEFIEQEQEGLFLSGLVPSVAEIVERTRDRNSVLIFTCSVLHAEAVARELEQSHGIQPGLVTGRTTKIERQAFIEAFRNGQLKYLVNCEVLTTGFDAPAIDAVAVLRATKSPGLFYQMVGRGFRIAPGKMDCIVLDYGNNVDRHGPLDSPGYGKHVTKGERDGKAPFKNCPGCMEEVPLGTIVCGNCGFEFEAKNTQQLDSKADTESEILQPIDTVEFNFGVIARRAMKHKKKQAAISDRYTPDTVRIMYETDETEWNRNLAFSEWLCVEHTGFARRKFETWWKSMSDVKVPNTIEECLDLIERGALVDVRSISVRKDGKYDRIVAYEREYPLPTESDLVDVLDEEEAPF